MVSSARYWRSKRASGTQGRVSLFFLPQNSFHVSAVQLCYKEALYMYLGHLPDFLKEKKKGENKERKTCQLVPQILGIWKLFLGEQHWMLAGKFITEQEGSSWPILMMEWDISSYQYFPVHSSVPHESWVSRTLCFHSTLYFAPSTDLNWNFCMVFYAKIEPDCMKW